MKICKNLVINSSTEYFNRGDVVSLITCVKRDNNRCYHNNIGPAFIRIHKHSFFEGCFLLENKYTDLPIIQFNGKRINAVFYSEIDWRHALKIISLQIKQNEVFSKTKLSKEKAYYYAEKTLIGLKRTNDFLLYLKNKYIIAGNHDNRQYLIKLLNDFDMESLTKSINELEFDINNKGLFVFSLPDDFVIDLL